MASDTRRTGDSRRTGDGRRETHAEGRDLHSAVVDVDTVIAAAARLLESRQRTVAELRTRLVAAGYRAPLVDAAVTRLTDLGYLDDEAFAHAWVASRDRAHPRGENALRVELARKGVDREVVRAVLEERAASAAGGPVGEGTGGGDTADEGAALRLLERRRTTLERTSDVRARRQRAYALLARNGFDPDTAARAAERFARGDAED